MVRDFVIEIEPAEPAVSQMQLDLLGQFAFRTEPIAVSKDEHAHHQLGVYGWSADLAVVGLQLPP